MISPEIEAMHNEVLIARYSLRGNTKLIYAESCNTVYAAPFNIGSKNVTIESMKQLTLLRIANPAISLTDCAQALLHVIGLDP